MSNGMKPLRIDEQMAGTIRNVNPTGSATNCVNCARRKNIMIAKNTAQRLVTEKINADYNIHNDELIIIDDLTIEKDYGSIFFYNFKRYLETEDISYLIAGNGPILVEKENGSIYELGTAFPVDEYLKRYEMNRAHFIGSRAQNTETIDIPRENEILNNVDAIA